MRRGVLVALATAVVLVGAPSATAGLAARLSVNPSVVDVDQLVRIELRAYSVTAAVRRLDDRTGRRLRVEAVSPEGWVVRIGLRHVTRGIWRGTYRFGGSGTWKIRVANWPRSGPAPSLKVTVREPSS